MAVFKRTVDFLPEDTKLMVAVNPSGNINGVLWQYIVRNIKTIAPTDSYFVPLSLDEPLKIEFRISRLC